MEARNWEHGVFLGSIMSSEKTAAASGNVGELRFDPMAMLPFCGYNMGDYFAHWLKIGQRDGAKLPRIFYVNWFRRGEDGKFLWPGFGENSRVLAWIFRRCEDQADAVESPVGLLPTLEGIDTDGLEVAPEAMEQLLAVDPEEWRKQLPQVQEHYARFGDGLPQTLREQLQTLTSQLDA
jgi:phosphoenolpyruvate carboxykinase (GTP)